MMNEYHTELTGLIRDLVSRELKALELLNEWHSFIMKKTTWNDEEMDLGKKTEKHFLETGR